MVPNVAFLALHVLSVITVLTMLDHIEHRHNTSAVCFGAVNCDIAENFDCHLLIFTSRNITQFEANTN